MRAAPRSACTTPTNSNDSSGANVRSSSSKCPTRYKFKWRADADKCVVSWNFERRGWTKTEGDDWNIYWASKATIRNIFNPEQSTFYVRLSDGQYVNHFPNHFELTRKDLLVKNINRYRREALRSMALATQKNSMRSGLECLEKEIGALSNTHPMPNMLLRTDTLEFLPTTFILPMEYGLFVKEFNRIPHSMWILKPSSKAQGKGISIVHNLMQMKKWATPTKPNNNSDSNPLSSGVATNTKGSINANASSTREVYVISRYIENPLLLGGKKFDLRMYVLVIHYRPLQAFVYREGFARFCNIKYSNELSTIDNPFIHLTNVAVQKQNEEYNVKHGGKWNLRNLLLYLDATRGKQSGAHLLTSIYSLMRHSLKSVQNVIINDIHSFECYGYDIIVDSNLKPWLCEVNASPSLSTTTADDQNMKSRLIRDVLELVVLNDLPEKRVLHPNPNISPSNGFQWLMNESELVEKERCIRELRRKQTQRPLSAQWR